MKKFLAILLTAMFVVTPFFAQETEETSDWKEQGKKALEETGKFFKKAGEKAKESYENASEVTCYGTWVYKTEDSTTTIIVNDDGTMEVRRKIGTDTDYWAGFFKTNLKIITFKIAKAGRSNALKDIKSSNPEQTWRLTYSVSDDGESMKIFSTDIPKDIDGTNFAKGVIFTKK